MSENQKKIWVTGASSGIGRAVAEKFAKEGWKVAVSARREEILNEMSKNENIFSFPLDVTNFDNCKSTFDKILKQLGNIDICFLCSGTYDPKKEQEINIEQNKFVMNVNYFGTLNCVKSVEEYFKKEKKGHISIVSSHTSEFITFLQIAAGDFSLPPFQVLSGPKMLWYLAMRTGIS